MERERDPELLHTAVLSRSRRGKFDSPRSEGEGARGTLLQPPPVTAAAPGRGCLSRASISDPTSDPGDGESLPLQRRDFCESTSREREKGRESKELCACGAGPALVEVSRRVCLRSTLAIIPSEKAGIVVGTRW